VYVQTVLNLTKFVHKHGNICDIKLLYYWTTCQDESSADICFLEIGQSLQSLAYDMSKYTLIWE
jgi:hypothetical protein